MDIQFQNILQQIGNTPLAQLDFNTKPTLLAKLEYLNPGGSIKDRAALFMIEQAERDGNLKPGGTIIEASSGNQGIALSMIGALKGYKVIITVPDRTSFEKIATLQAYGTKVYVCPDTDRLAQKGYLVGLSSGAVMHVTLDYVKKLNKEDIVVVIFADSGRAYLSKVFNV